MSKEIFFKNEGKNKMLSGINKTVDAIKSTMGAAGRNVFLWRPYGAPHNTNDGYTIAKEISLIDPTENMGAELVKEVAKTTVDQAGDGTSAASLLLQAIVTQGMVKIEEKVNVMNMKRGIEKAVNAVVEKIKQLSQPIDTHERLIQIATISANNDNEMGKLIAEAVREVGKDGVITVEENKEYKTVIEYADGMSIDCGYASPYFMNTPEKGLCVLNEPHILLFGGTLDSFKKIIKVIDNMVATNHKPLLIIADDFKGDVIHGLLVNIKNGLQVCCVKSPSKEIMEDIAIVTGATYINDKMNVKVEEIKVHHFGKAESVKIGALTTEIIDGNGKEEEIEKRVKEIEFSIDNAISDFDTTKLKERLAKLNAGVAIIKVGARTDTELNESKDRIDDAKCATIAAMEEGYVAGAGTTFLHCLSAIKDLTFDNEDEKTGAEIVRVAIQYPFSQILINAGLNPDDYLASIAMKPYGFGVNVRNNQVENLLDTGVIDPTKVLRCSLQNAASTAALLLITECVVSENI